MLDGWLRNIALYFIFLFCPIVFILRRRIKIFYFDFLQGYLRKKVLFSDDFDGELRYVGGIDISFIKNDSVNACISLVVLDLETLDTVLSESKMISMTCEYIPGYLAFRETPHIAEMLRSVKQRSPQFYPHVLMVDGNGRLHRKEFGMACQTGVTCDIPCIGVAKNLFQMEGCLRDESHKDAINQLKEAGDTFLIRNIDNTVIGCALKSTTASSKPVYVSEGHRVSLQTACEVVRRCCRYRVPEPVRLADITSREVLRKIDGNL